MKTKIYEVKEVEEALQLASAEFGISEDDLIEIENYLNNKKS